jgi:hypothetical protein
MSTISTKKFGIFQYIWSTNSIKPTTKFSLIIPSKRICHLLITIGLNPIYMYCNLFAPETSCVVGYGDIFFGKYVCYQLIQMEKI